MCPMPWGGLSSATTCGKGKIVLQDLLCEKPNFLVPVEGTDVSTVPPCSRRHGGRTRKRRHKGQYFACQDASSIMANQRRIGTTPKLSGTIARDELTKYFPKQADKVPLDVSVAGYEPGTEQRKKGASGAPLRNGFAARRLLLSRVQVQTEGRSRC
jgi:hypothetical protein